MQRCDGTIGPQLPVKLETVEATARSSRYTMILMSSWSQPAAARRFTYNSRKMPTQARVNAVVKIATTVVVRLVQILAQASRSNGTTFSY
jgi:hypothetical protein